MKLILFQFPQPTTCSTDTTDSSQLILICPNGTNLTEIPFSSTDILWLSTITSFSARGENNTRGPFTSIPSNICWMSNLITLNLTYNQLADTLNYSSFINCSIPWTIIDLNDNYLTTFPSTLFTLNRFNSVYLNNNQLTSIDLSIVALVQNLVDLRNNRITSIINPTNFNISLNLQTGDTLILLDGNLMLEFNDTIYEIYGACEELQQGLSDTLNRSSLTLSLGNIDFGSTQVNCSCDQYYITEMLHLAFRTPILGRISSLSCANQRLKFVDYTCSLGYSTANFTQVQPRLRQLDQSNLTTTLISTTPTTISTSSTQTTSTTTSTETTTTTTSITTSTITISTTTSTETTKTTTTSTETTSTTITTTSTETISTTTSIATTSTTTTTQTTTTTSTTTSTVTTSTTTPTQTTLTTTSTETTSTTTTTTSIETISTTTSTETTSTTTAVVTSISTVNITTCQATFSISNTNLLLTCPSNMNLSLLPINNYGFTMLDRITFLKIEGYNGARGPLQTIPSNICFLTNLRILNISFNRLDHLDSIYLSSNPSCLETLRTLDMSNNYLTEYPSLFLTKITNLQQLFLQNNQLTSFDLSLLIFVSTSVNLSNNQISTITNNANINISSYTYSLETLIDLTNNSEIIDLTDAIYEMYGACYEIYQIFNTSIPSITSVLTIGFLNINFGRSKINCTCDQYYIEKSFIYSLGFDLSSNYPLSNIMCTDGELFYNNTNIAACSASSVNVINTKPRLCKIKPDNGNITYINTTENITGTYPYYLTQTLNSSYCLFTFYIGGKQVSIDCINGSKILPEITLPILNNIYFQNITQVIINNQSSLSQLPSYLCSLPSTSIDLSNQSFIILDKNTFPCLLNSTLENINLAYNQIISVNLTLSNWILIDLTSNNLTQLPYSLFNFNQNQISSKQFSQRNLLLSLNKLSQFDLFIYTYANTYINLEKNSFLKTIYGYNILNNYQKQSLRTGPVLTDLILSNQMHFLFNDQIAQDYDTCDSLSLNYLIEIFQYMKNNNNMIIEIQCDCSSIYIKEYFFLFNSSVKLTNEFLCSNISNLTITEFESLTETDCLSNITLSTNRLCQFERIQNSSLSSIPLSTENNQLLAIVLGSVLGSFGFILLIAVIIGGICYKRKSPIKTTHISTISRVPYTNNDCSEVQWPYNLPTNDISLENSNHLSQEKINNYHQKLKEPPIDYDTNLRIFRLEDPSYVSSYV